MTGDDLLTWAMLSVSLGNTILLFWLGLTVLLNAERRTGGLLLAGGGLLLGAAFFVSHSVILGYGITYIGARLDFWWLLGWVPVLALPFAWYLVMLWYAGFWETPGSALHRRHRAGLALAGGLALALAGLFLFANPFLEYWRVAQLNLDVTPAVGRIPLLVLAYPVYIIICIGLSLDLLLRPGPAERVMGDLARRLARPWLVATAGMLLAVGLLAGGSLLWIVINANERRFDNIYLSMALPVALADLAIESLIGGAIILLGQAIVSYEIFTGKTLPRRGFVRQWRSAIILAAGWGALMAGSLTRHWHPLSGLLLATLLMTLAYALFQWRSYAERERYMAQLRPFVASQRLYEDLLSRPGAAPAALDAATPFHALCGEVLGARVGYLVAVGPLAALAGPPLAYPADTPPPLDAPAALAARFASPETIILPLDPARYGGAAWAVPLWSERGLIGLLLLGDRRDGGLYTQEEIEIARASGERLVDTRASAEIAGRLMLLQRRHLTESQVIDRRARRVLHDDVLPQLHTAILALSAPGAGDGAAPAEALRSLAEVHRQIADLLREMPTGAAPEVARLGLLTALQRTVQDELGSAFDAVTWQIAPAAAEAAGAVPALPAEVLFYAAREAIRNAARHGRAGDPARPLRLHVAAACPAGLEILIEDDGVGLSAAPRAGGSGQGLALHSTMMAVVGGALATESVPGRYTRVRLSLPPEALALPPAGVA